MNYRLIIVHIDAQETMRKKVGQQIINNLSKHYGFKIPSINLIDDLEKRINLIYDNMYFKVYDTYYQDFIYVEELLEQKSLLFPILKLIKLFMLINSNSSVYNAIRDYSEMFEKVKRYNSFFTDELNELLKIVSLFFESDYSEEEYSEDFNNALSYQIIASKCFSNKRYIEAIFFSNEAKSRLFKDYNFQRFLYVNHILLSSLLFLGNYDKCYLEAKNHYLCVKSLQQSKEEISKSLDYLVLSLLGQKKYEKVVEELTDLEELNLTKLTALLVSLNVVNKGLYQEYLNDINNTEGVEQSDKDYVNGLSYYLRHKDKKLLIKFEKYDIMPVIIKILKKI